MASTNTQPPSHQLTSINFLAFPFDIRCIIYSFIDLSFCEERPDYCLSDDLIACSTGALTGCPLLDCSATMRTEAFAYAVRQSPPVLREDTLLPFTAPACTKMVEYLERTKNFDVFLRNIDDLHFDLRESRNPEALAMLEKCTSLSAITLSIEVDEVDTSAPDIVPQGLMNLLLKLPEMNCVTIEVLDSRDGAMKTLEELGSEDMVRKWQYLERHVDTDLRALVELAGLSEEQLHWVPDKPLKFGESYTYDETTKVWDAHCFLKPHSWDSHEGTEDAEDSWTDEDSLFDDEDEDYLGWSDVEDDDDEDEDEDD